MSFDDWMRVADADLHMRCPSCNHVGSGSWLPAVARPGLVWFRCDACDHCAIVSDGQVDYPPTGERCGIDWRSLLLQFAARGAGELADLIGMLPEARVALEAERTRL